MKGLALLLGCGVLACDVTPEQIARWKETERGPNKLRETLRRSSIAPDLRGQALAALVELGMMPQVSGELTSLDRGEREAVVHAAIPRLIRLARGAGQGPTTRVEREAKDALFVLRAQAPPSDRRAIDDELVNWLIVDLVGREDAGGHSGTLILTTIGAHAAPRLAELVVDGKRGDSERLAAAGLIGKLADRGLREQVGARLVEQVRRELEPNEIVLKRIGLVGGDHVVAYLTALAEDVHQPVEVRARALFALAQRPDGATLPSAFRLAVDKKTPGKVRDAAFELVEKVGAAALPQLIALLSSAEDYVRWRAVEAALAVGREQAVAQVLEALPTTLSPSRDDLDSFVVHDLKLIGAAALPSLRQELGSRSWLARLAAIEAIAVLGRADDVPALEPLTRDGWSIKGWKKATIGSEARDAIAALRRRR